MKRASMALLAICWLSATIICLTDACRGSKPPTKIHGSLPKTNLGSVKVMVDSHIDLSNRDLADFLYFKVSEQYPNRHVLVLVYNAVAGFDNHAIIPCSNSGMLYFRAGQKKNVVVALGTDKGSKAFSIDSAMRTLRVRERRLKFTDDDVSSRKWLADFKHVLDCNSVFLVAAINVKGSSLAIVGTPGSVALDTGYKYPPWLNSPKLDPETKVRRDQRRSRARQHRIIFG